MLWTWILKLSEDFVLSVSSLDWNSPSGLSSDMHLLVQLFVHLLTQYNIMIRSGLCSTWSALSLISVPYGRNKKCSPAPPLTQKYKVPVGHAKKRDAIGIYFFMCTNNTKMTHNSVKPSKQSHSLSAPMSLYHWIPLECLSCHWEWGSDFVRKWTNGVPCRGHGSCDYSQTVPCTIPA